MNEEDGTWTPGACITNPIEQEIENDQKAS